jgi:hypothetical protein
LGGGFLLTACGNTPTTAASGATTSTSTTPAPTTTTSTDPYHYNTAIVRYIYQGGACAPATLDTYPLDLCSPPIDTTRDSFGFGNRDCGSYALWMEYSTGHKILPPGLRGRSRDLFRTINHAGFWPQTLPGSWLTSVPEPGDVAVRPAIPGFVEPGGEKDEGHAMYIVATDYDGTGDLLVKQYNSQNTGDFSEAVVAPSGDYYGHPFTLVYVQFPLR